MALTSFFNRKPKTITEVPLDYKPSMFHGGVIQLLAEKFKGAVENNKIKFPNDLGEEHPFDFEAMEKLYKKFGLFAAVVDKYIDFIWGSGFYVTCDDERAQEIIEEFMKDINFDSLARHWTKEALVKGNGFLEIGGDVKNGIEGLKILNANNMYVVRDEYGVVQGFNQYIGGFKNFNLEKAKKDKKVISFSSNEIAHVPFNLIGDCAYGLGIGVTAMKFIDDFLTQDNSVHHLMKRKANAPLHAKLGYINGDIKIIPKQEDVQALGQDMENLSNKTNWATDPLVEFKVVDFGNIGEKFEMILEHDMEKLIYAFQIPAVLLGKANIPEGLAKVQMEAFQRRIQSIQTELEKIIEEKIFTRVLQANGFDVHVEFEWGTPSIMEVEARMGLISELIKSPTVSKAMRRMLEDEMITLLDLDKDQWKELKLEEEQKTEEERKRLEAQPQPVVPGQNKTFPKPVVPKAQQPKQPKPQPQEVAIKVDTIKLEKSVDELEKKISSIKVKEEESISEPIVKKNLNKGLKIKRKHKNYEYEKVCPHCEESFDNLNDIHEWLGFNYKQYLAEILSYLSEYSFDQIKAITEIELAAGYLSESQVNTLKGILEKGFKTGASLKDMAEEVNKKVNLKDLYRMDKGEIKTGASGLPILARSADKRAIGIVRSEVTRMANGGAIEYYKKNEITQVRWIASYGQRTCPICEDLNNQIYEINSVPAIPVHPSCRCTITPVTEVK